jgi:hypothetical protein
MVKIIGIKKSVFIENFSMIREQAANHIRELEEEACIEDDHNDFWDRCHNLEELLNYPYSDLDFGSGFAKEVGDYIIVTSGLSTHRDEWNPDINALFTAFQNLDIDTEEIFNIYG